MSSILEALKKLEEEKAARRGGGGNIAGKVTAAGRRARQRPAWLMPAGMAAAAAVAVLVTYAVMGGLSSRQGETAPRKGTEPASPRLVIPAPQPAAPGSSKAAPAATGQPQRGSSPAARAVQGSPIPAPAREPEPPAPPPREIPAGNGAALPHPPAGEQLPAISVTGIAWQKDSAGRLAVVNGSPVAEGAVIEGARVREILPDRVLFSFNRKEFEVHLGKGGQ